MSNADPRIMLYSHDTYGLGHLRRSLSIASQLSKDFPTASQLLVSGSAISGAFGMPDRFDVIKLPSLTKRKNGGYKARSLPLSISQVIHWREQMILQAALSFQPDLLLVDKTPAGVQEELLPTLQYLKSWRPETRLVLGMRDVEDGPEATQAEWEAGNVRRLHENIYDCILLYGQREIFDPVVEYDMSDSARRKLIPVGYLGRVAPVKSRDAVRHELGTGNRSLIVVTVGGGGDGFGLLDTVIEALQMKSGALSEAHVVMVTGPLMARGKRELIRSAVQFDRLTLLEFTPDLISYMAAADLVVGMGGYNTVREALSLQTRLLVVPRIHPRIEQLLRAQRLAERGMLRFLIPDELSPQRLAEEVELSLSTPIPAMSLDFDGLERVSQVIANLLAGNFPANWDFDLQAKFPAPKTLESVLLRETRSL